MRKSEAVSLGDDLSAPELGLVARSEEACELAHICV